MNNITQAITIGIQPYLARVPMNGAQWADEYFYLSPESSGTEGRWKCFPYQIGLLNWMTCDDIEEINFMKSRRVGYTKCLLAAVGCAIEQKNRNVAIWQPTDGDAKDFVTDEVETILRDVPVLGRRLKCRVGAKSKHNTLEKKVFDGATLDIKGGKSARNFRRMTKDMAVYDETDAFDRDIDGEGSCFTLGDGRLDQAPFPKSIRGSTPKTKNASLIESAVENSDRIFYRFLPCPHCGARQRLEFKNLKWIDGNPDTAHFLCPANGCQIYYRDYAGMDQAGRWQTIDGYYYDDDSDRFFDPFGDPIHKPRTLGARIWAAYSYLRPWSYVVAKWIAANKDAKNGNITTLKAVVNTLLGETWEEKGESVDDKTIGARGEYYLDEGTIPVEVLVITAGVDVQGGANPRLEIEIVGHGLEYESWSLDYVVLPGDVEKPDVWNHLDELLKRKFKRDDGVEMIVACTFIDSGYLANEVYKFTGPRRRRGIYATKGVLNGMLCNKGTWQGDKGRGRAILRTMNVDDAKTIIFNRLKIEKAGPGFCHFPDHYSAKYYKHLTNEEKKIKRRRGLVIGHEWIKKGTNEPLDCRCYALGALEFLRVNFEKTKLTLEKQATRIAAAPSERSAVNQGTGDGRQPRGRPAYRRPLRNRNDFVNRWRH